MGTGFVTGYGFGHVIAQVQGQGPEAVHLELGGIFSAEGVDLGPELGESHCLPLQESFGIGEMCAGAWIPASAGMTGEREWDGEFRVSGHFRTNPAFPDRRAGRGRIPGSYGEAGSGLSCSLFWSLSISLPQWLC